MKQSNIIIIFTSIVVAFLIIAGFIYIKQYAPKYKWNPTYRHNSDNPYDTKFLYLLLKKKFGDKNFELLKNKPSEVVNKEDSTSMFFYIGYNSLYDSTTVEWFKDFLNRGNKVCIASDFIPTQLLNSIFNIDSNYFYSSNFNSKTLNTRFLNDSVTTYSFHHQFRKDTTSFNWKYFSDSTIKVYWRNYLYSPISEIDSARINCLQINYGEGQLFVYTTPLLLSNYYLATEQGYNYANAFFKSMGTCDKLYWDNFSKLPQMYNSKRSPINLNNPLEFILKQTSLRWAWYIFLGGIFLFAAFKLKRRQRTMDIVVEDKNTSIEYAKAVGLLHYKTSNHQELTNRLIKIFQQYINSRYGISQSLERDVQIKKVSLASGLPLKKIEEIYKSHFKVKFNPEPEVRDTIKLHSQLEFFYKNCK